MKNMDNNNTKVMRSSQELELIPSPQRTVSSLSHSFLPFPPTAATESLFFSPISNSPCSSRTFCSSLSSTLCGFHSLSCPERKISYQGSTHSFFSKSCLSYPTNFSSLLLRFRRGSDFPILSFCIFSHFVFLFQVWLRTRLAG